MANPRIVVFEDLDKNFEQLKGPLAARLEGVAEIVRYEGEREVKDGNWAAAEGWVREFLMVPAPATLAIVDSDLTAFSHPAPQQFIRAIADEQAIPTVHYQSKVESDHKIKRLRRWQEKGIGIEPGTDHATIAVICADAALGFHRIAEKVAGSGETPRLLDTLRNLLQPPSDAPLHLEQFAIGSQELLGVIDARGKGDALRFVATWMGYLIFNRILAFPGPILNKVATAAYLSIAPVELESPDIQEALLPARYAGPFNGSGAWWRSALDTIIAASLDKEARTVPTGHVVLEKLLTRKIKASRCHDGEELDEEAYLCILTNDVVCSRHSDTPEAWIPQGADRCRIHTDDFEALKGWLGML